MTRGGLDLEHPVEELDALAHPEQPQARRRRLGGVEAAAVVLDHHEHARRLAGQHDADVGSTGVLDHVRERLLHDPVQRGLNVGGKTMRTEPGFDLHVELTPLTHGLAEPAESGLEAEVVERGGTQLDGQPPDVLQRLDDEVAELGGCEMGGLGGLRALDPGEAEEYRRQRLARLVVQLPGETPALHLLGLHGTAQGIALHAARVLDRNGRLRREQRDDLLVLLGEAPVRPLLGEVEVSERDPLRHHRDAEKAAHRRVVGWKADRARIAHQVVQPQRPRVVDQHPENPLAAGKLTDRSPGGVVDPVRHEALELVAAAVDDPERRVAGLGQLGGDPDEGLQDGVERQLRGDRDARFDERPPSLVEIHSAIQPVRRRTGARLQADFIPMPPVPKPRTAKSGKNRNLIIALVVAGVVAVALIAGGLLLTGGGGSSAATTASTDTTSTGGKSPAVVLVSGIPQHGTVLGSPDTTVRMVQFEDLQCPICKEYTDGAFPAIVNDYVRTGRIRLDFRGLAFLGPDSLKALKIAIAAGFQNKLWQVVGLFYANQGAENSGWVTDSLIDQILAEVPGLDAAKVKADAQGPKVAKEIAAAQAEGNALKVPGTPAFYLGIGVNKLYKIEPRAFVPSEFRPAIDDALKG